MRIGDRVLGIGNCGMSGLLWIENSKSEIEEAVWTFCIRIARIEGTQDWDW